MGSAALSSSVWRLPPSPMETPVPASGAASSPFVRLLAEIIETSVDLRDSGALSLSLDRGLSLRVALDGLPLYQRSLLSRRFGGTGAAEFGALAQEADPELFAEGLLHLAQRQFSAGRAEASMAIGSVLGRFLAESEGGGRLPPPLRARLAGEVAALQGGGTVGQRVERHLQTFAREATHPAMLAGFGFGAAAFQSARFLALTRLGAASASFLTRGFGARFLAGTVGWAAEVPALTFGSRGVRAAMGESVHWNSRALGHELGATAITLGLMRAAAFGARRGFEALHGLPASGSSLRWAAATPISGPAFQQGAMLGSLMLAHEIEARLGLRPASDLAGNFTDSLAMLLQFYVGGRLFHALQPAGFSRALQLAESHSRTLSGPRLSWPRLAMGHRSRTGQASAAAVGPGLDILWMADLPKRGTEPGLEARPGGPPSRSTTAPKPFKFRDLAEEAPDPVIVTDLAGRAIYLNRAGRELVEGTPLAWLQGGMEESFRPVEGEPEIFMYSRRGAEPSFWRIRSQVLDSGEGMKVHYLRDISAERLLEEAKVMLEMKNFLAEGLIHDAGHMLAVALLEERVLEQTLAQAPRAAFPPGVSSRYPLTGREGETPLSMRSMMNSILGRIKNLGGTLNTTMQVFQDSQRTLAGGHHVRILPMRVLLEKALRFNEKMRERSGIRLVTDFGEEPPIMMGEEAPLLSAVLNLLINACHAMPKGGELRVRTFAEDGMVTIEVQDTGVGIASENMAHIFEPHFTTKEHSGGTGMGLANVKIAVERIHRGRIEVESEEGRSTTFRLVLPQTRPRQRSR